MGLRLDLGVGGQYADIVGSVLSWSADYTILMRVRMYGTSTHAMLVTLEGGTLYESMWVSNTGKLSLIADHTSGEGTPISGTTTMDVGVDYYCALVRSGEDLTVYLNHAVECSHPTNRLAGPADTITLGDFQAITLYPDCEVEAIWAWQRALSVEEMQRQAACKRVLDARDLYGFWPLLPGNHTQDLSGNGHHWTEYNSPTDTSTVGLPWGGAPLGVPDAAGGASGDISGTSAGAATTSGTLSGPGALAGASTGTCTPTGALSGPGELSGSTAGTATTSGSMDGGAVSGSTTGTSTTSGNLSGPGALAAVLAAAATLAGALSGVGGLASATTGTSTVSGSLGGSGPVTGTSTGAASTTGTLTATAAMVGTVTGTSTVTGTFLGGAIGGEAAGSAVVTGTLTATWDMTGGVTGTTVVTGEMTGELFAIATAGTLRDALGNPVVPSIPAGAQWRVVLTGPAADAPCVTIVVRAIEGAG